MYCSACGHRGGPGDSYCYHCGLVLESPEAPFPEGAATAGAAATPLRVPWGPKELVLGIALVVATVVVMVLTIAVAVRLGYVEEGSFNALLTWVTSHVVGVAIFGAIWLMGLRRYRLSLPSMGLRPPQRGARWVVVATGAALGLSLGFTALYGFFVERLGIDILMPPEVPGDIVFRGAAAVLSFEALAIWTPFTEELFFRGFIFAGLASRWGLVRGLWVSAAIFSLFHVSPGVMIPIFVTGLLLAWLYYRTNSLWPPIAAHAGQNAIALLATMYGG